MSFRLTFLIHKFLSLWFKYFVTAVPVRRKVRNVIDSDTKVEDHNKIPSSEHLALEKLLQIVVPKEKSLKTWRKLMDDSILKYSTHKKFNVLELPVADTLTNIFEFTSHGVNNKDVAVVYLHGGGYCGGSVKGYWSVPAKFCQFCKMKVFAVDYNTCPDVSLQQMVQQCLKAYQFVLKTFKDVILVGDSAGAGLCIAVLQNLIQGELFQQLPKACVLISPYCDFEGLGESYISNAATDFLISSAFTEVYKESMTLSGGEKLNFLSGSFLHFPKTLITASETELLYSDAVEICKKIREANGLDTVVFESKPYGVHDYPLFGALVPEYEESFRRICQFIERASIYAYSTQVKTSHI